MYAHIPPPTPLYTNSELETIYKAMLRYDAVFDSFHEAKEFAISKAKQSNATYQYE